MHLSEKYTYDYNSHIRKIKLNLGFFYMTIIECYDIKKIKIKNYYI